MHTSRVSIFAIGAVAAAISACTVPRTPAPPLVGPSTLGKSLTITASPDVLTANGQSTSEIRVLARDANGQPLAGLRLRVDIVDGDTIVDTLGTLPKHELTTDGTGQDSVVYTAPPQPVPGVDPKLNVNIRVIPISTDFGSETPRYVVIRLVPPASIVVPGAPFARFTFAPTSPAVNALVVFNASSSYDTDGSIASYAWDWDDGESVTKSTPLEDHDFAAAGTYNVKLTVTDNSGLQGFQVQQVVVK